MELNESNIELLENMLNKLGIQIANSDGSSRPFADVIVEIQAKSLLIDSFTRDMMLYALLGAIDYSMVYKVEVSHG